MVGEDGDSAEELKNTLSSHFDASAVCRVTFALTTEVSILGYNVIEGFDLPLSVVGLGNIAKIDVQYANQKKPRVFPIAFSSVACSCQGEGVPEIYRELTTDLRDRLREENEEEEIVKLGTFQIYTTLKQQIRRSEKSFYGGQSIVTGATCPSSDLGGAKDRRTKKKFEKLLRDEEPFRQIIEGVATAEEQKHFNTRFEPVVSIEMGNILGTEGEGLWEYVVNRVVVDLFQVFRENVEEICLATVDIYSPVVWCHELKGERLIWQLFPGIYRLWARMLRCFIEPGLDLLKKERRLSGTEMLYATELVANGERLLVEMFSGNETIVPGRYWTHFDVVDGIYHRSFPSFDKTKIDFQMKRMQLETWPTTKEEGKYMFIQSAGVRYHYSQEVYGKQIGALEKVIKEETRKELTKTELLQGCKEVVRLMKGEWREIVREAFLKDISRELAELREFVDRTMDRDRRVARSTELRGAQLTVEGDDNVFSEG